MARRGLGEQLNQALTGHAPARGSGEPSAALVLPRAAWAYYVAAAGGAIVGLAAIVLLYAVVSGPSAGGAGRIAMYGLVAGSGVLAIGWFGMATEGPWAVAPMLGSAALCGGLLWVITNQGWDQFQTRIVVTELAFAAFAIAHLFARGLTAVQIAAGLLSMGMAVQLIATATHHRLGRGVDEVLGYETMGAVAAVGLGLAVLLLARRPRAS